MKAYSNWPVSDETGGWPAIGIIQTISPLTFRCQRVPPQPKVTKNDYLTQQVVTSFQSVTFGRTKQEQVMRGRGAVGALCRMFT